jgi:hypothetical protein
VVGEAGDGVHPSEQPYEFPGAGAVVQRPDRASDTEQSRNKQHEGAERTCTRSCISMVGYGWTLVVASVVVG